MRVEQEFNPFKCILSIFLDILFYALFIVIFLVPIYLIDLMIH